MAKHSIYIRKEHEMALQEAAKRAGLEVSTLLGQRLNELLSHTTEREKIDLLEVKIDRLERRANAVFDLLEIIAGELGHVGGIVRGTTKTSELAVQAGASHEATLKRISESIRMASCEEKFPPFRRQ